MAIKTYKREVDRKPGSPDGTRYSEKQKREAVTLLMLTGSPTLVERQMGISDFTLREWRRSAWWPEYEREIRNGSRMELKGNLKTIVDKSLRVVEDRLENGDWQYDQKLGKMVRVPVKAQVANVIAQGAIDRQFMIDRLQREETEAQDTEAMKDRLERLHEEFARFAKAKTINAIPGEVIQQPHTAPAPLALEGKESTSHAEQKPETSPHDAGSSAQPGLRQEGGDSRVSRPRICGGGQGEVQEGQTA